MSYGKVGQKKNYLKVLRSKEIMCNNNVQDSTLYVFCNRYNCIN